MASLVPNQPRNTVSACHSRCRRFGRSSSQGGSQIVFPCSRSRSGRLPEVDLVELVGPFTEKVEPIAVRNRNVEAHSPPSLPQADVQVKDRLGWETTSRRWQLGTEVFMPGHGGACVHRWTAPRAPCLATAVVTIGFATFPRPMAEDWPKRPPQSLRPIGAAIAPWGDRCSPRTESP